MNRKQRRMMKSSKPPVQKEGLVAKITHLFDAAVNFHKEGRIQEAKKLYIEIINLDNRHCSSYNNLGLVLQAEGNLVEAEKMFKNAVLIFNGYIDAYNNLGNLHNGLANYDHAIMYYDSALKIAPKNPSLHVNIGNAYQSKGKFEQAYQHYNQALSIDSNLTEAHVSLGNLFNRVKRVSDSVICYQRALALSPDYANAYNNLGYALRIQSRVVRAAQIFERALRIDPNHFDTYVNYGGSHKDVGRVDVALGCYERALSLNPNSVNAMSNLLFAHNYTDSLTPEQVSWRHIDIGRQIEAVNKIQNLPFPNSKAKNRRLRIGYVSPDFRQHAVTFFFEPLLRSHDHSKVEIFCYAELFVEDHVSKRLQGLSDHWLITVGLTDDELAARVRADGIDILVDVAGHTAHSRLAVFARKPAPIQVTWLGYPNTTGLSAMDYRFVDAVTDPPGQGEALASETLFRLPGIFLCYQPPPEAPDPVALPSEETGYITFGTFSTLAKLSPSTLDAWVEILKRAPGSRLLLKSRLFIEEETRQLYHSRLIERGVDGNRIIFKDPIVDTTQHLASYNLIDIALDPFPYNGTTTTCEALWMGVPMIVLAGKCHAGRVGASLLQQVDLPELVADTVERYVEIAASLAADTARLKSIRMSLRDRMRRSRLCDANTFTRSIEQAYGEIWERWCDAP